MEDDFSNEQNIENNIMDFGDNNLDQFQRQDYK